MKDDLRKALDNAEKRLEEMLPKIKERHKKGLENSSDEPSNLRSGTSDELAIQRAIKEQNDDELPE